MADDFKSLLGKGSGQSWGELAGSYFSRNNKKSNRSRNILLASLFMNAAEARMQSKAMTNLQDLEDSKAIEKAKLAAQWKKRTDLETAYKDINDQGALGYYEDQAEKAFQAANAENSKWANLSSGAIVKAKQDWKEAWAQNKANTEVLNPYKGIDTSITTLEEFSKDYNDYYKAQKRNYASPKNISVVHNLFSKIGIGGKEPGEIDKATNKFVSTVEKERAEYDRQQKKIKGYTVIEAAPFKKSALDKAKLQGMQLDDDDFNTLINSSTLGNNNSGEALAVVRAAKQEFKDNGGTLQAAIAAISSKELGYNMAVNVAKRDRAVSAYELTNPKPAADSSELELWNANRKKAIRDSLGLTDLSEDAMLRARELFSIAFKTDPGLDQKEFINDVLTEDIRKATGGVNVNDLKAEIMKTRAMDIIDLYGEKDPETMGRAKVTMITKEQLDSMSKNYQDLHKKLIAMPKIMQDGELNLDVLNNNITTFSKGEQTIIRNYQRDNDMAIQADIAYYAAEEIGDAILRALGDKNPLNLNP
jgi:hypothetical protein